MYNLKNSQEVERGNFVGTGIHDFLVDKIVFQPEGQSIHDEKDKNGNLRSFGWEQIRVFITAEKTHAGEQSKGASFVFDIADPAFDPTKLESKLNRILHIFGNMTTKDKKDKAQEYIRNINVSTFKELAGKLGVFKGKKVRLKLTANDKNYVTLPGYISGIAEAADVDFEKSELKYDAAKEGRKDRDTANTESTSGSASSAAEVFGNTPNDIDDLPF